MNNTKYLDIAPTEKCSCGKYHVCPVDDVIVGRGAVNQLPAVLQKYNAKKVFIVADPNTYAVAGKQVCDLLEGAGLSYSTFIFKEKRLEPTEYAVGSLILHFDPACDTLLSIGSGVINDITKILSTLTGAPYVIVATAPSMDGYASASSSMVRDGLKVSINSKTPNVIIGDTDILKTAPDRMLQAGLGDMLAKYVGVCEWRIANIICGEYYCEKIAALVRTALQKCVDNADGLLKREDAAIEAVFEGLIITGLAMAYAGVSRPASGGEHYISHIWDMRALEKGELPDLHGIQCALGTLYSARCYEALRTLSPDKNKAAAYVSDFSFEKWADELRGELGNAAEAMIELEQKEKKYDTATHSDRFDKIAANWQEIVSIIQNEIPSAKEILEILEKTGTPTDAAAIGIDPARLPFTLKASKDIRDKYVLARLLWDLGVLDEFAGALAK